MSPHDEQLLHVLQRAWGSPFTTRSDFSRQHSDDIAKAACMGLLTVRHDRQQWGRSWRITALGLQLLETSP